MVERTSTCTLQVRKEEQALHAPSLKPQGRTSSACPQACAVPTPSPQGEEALHARKFAQSLLQVPKKNKLCKALQCSVCPSQKNALQIVAKLSCFQIVAKSHLRTVLARFGYFWMMRQFARKSPNCRNFFWLGPKCFPRGPQIGLQSLLGLWGLHPGASRSTWPLGLQSLLQKSRDLLFVGLHVKTKLLLSNFQNVYTQKVCTVHALLRSKCLRSTCTFKSGSCNIWSCTFKSGSTPTSGPGR